MTFLAAIGWPAATIVISIVAFLTIVSAVSVWQVFATGRRAIGDEGGKQYRRLAEELAAMQRETTTELQKRTTRSRSCAARPRSSRQGSASSTGS